MFQLNEQLYLKKCSLLRMFALCHGTHRSSLQSVELMTNQLMTNKMQLF